jgi:CheY-like chemotaxis protein
MTKRRNREVNPGTISVLYVDDESSNQLAMKAILASQQHVTVTDALDEEDAFEYLDEAEVLPDIVLMDQGLGHITGAEVFTRHHSHEYSRAGLALRQCDSKRHGAGVMHAQRLCAGAGAQARQR